MENNLSILNAKQNSPIINFYKEKCIFLTGGTGFLGTVVLHKLLLACKCLKRIYVLIKPKPNIQIKDRLEKLINSEVFDKVRESNPNILKQAIAVKGNLLEENLGLSEEDIQTLYNEVSVVFHSAANINFDEPLAELINNNTVTTERMVRFCKGMKLLQAFVYVSTAFSNCNQIVIDEKVYKTTNTWDAIKYIKSKKNMETFPRNLLEGRANKYTYTKALAENIILNEIDSIPAAIIRPSIIIGAETEPLPGWVSSWQGLTKALIQQGKGQLRCWMADPQLDLDMIPVDYVANLMITAAWDVHKERNNHKKEVRVFNCCSGTRNPVTVETLINANLKYSGIHFKREVFTKPFVLTIQNCTLFWITFFFVQTIPTYLWRIVDCVRKPKRGMSAIDIHRRIYNMIRFLEYFNRTQFAFVDRNVKDLYNKMDKYDRDMFNFDVENIHWDRHFEILVLGFKKYLLKEKPMDDSTPPDVK